MVATASPAGATLPQVTLRAPLVSLEVCRAVLRLNTAETLRLVESGALPWCFNVALDTSGFRRELRVLAQCLADLQTGHRMFQGGEEEWPAVLHAVFPMLAPVRPGVVSTLRADTVARQLCIKSTHCLALADSGAFAFARGAVRYPGPNGSPALQMPSVLAWLKSRRVA